MSVPGYIVFNIGSYLASNTSSSNPGKINILTSGPGQVYFGSNPNYNLINTVNLYKTNNIDNNIFNQSVIKDFKNYNSFALSKGSTIIHATKNLEIILGDATKFHSRPSLY